MHRLIVSVGKINSTLLPIPPCSETPTYDKNEEVHSSGCLGVGVGFYSVNKEGGKLVCPGHGFENSEAEMARSFE